jgi:hypothetical protein
VRRIRNDNVHGERRYGGASADQEIVKTPDDMDKPDDTEDM